MESSTIQWKNSDNSSKTPPECTACRRLGLHNVIGTSANLFKFLQSNSSTIIDLCMTDCTFETTELRLIFSIIGANLRSMTLSDVRVTGPFKKQPPVNLLKTNMSRLRSLTLFFKNAFDFDYITTIVFADRVKIMYCHDERPKEPSDALIRFLANQRKLTTLSLRCSSQFLTKLMGFRNIKFRVQSLSLESADKFDAQQPKAACLTRDLMTLVDSQRQSLVDLNLDGYVLSESQVVTLMRTSLKYLILMDCSFAFKREIYALSSTIEQLDFSNMSTTDEELESGLCSFLRCCREVRELHLKAIIKDETILNTISNFLPKLHKLRIDSSDYPPPVSQQILRLSRGM